MVTETILYFHVRFDISNRFWYKGASTPPPQKKKSLILEKYFPDCAAEGRFSIPK